MEHRRTLGAFCAGVIGTLALTLALQQGQGGHPGRNDQLGVTDVAAMRIYRERTQALPVTRVVVGEVGANLDRSCPPGPPVIRVDMEVRGQHVSVWVKDVVDNAPPAP